MERWKARLLVNRYTQNDGIDCTETFSPFVKMVTVRSIIAVAVKRGWKMLQLDVNNASLRGDLHEKIYMKVPQGLEVADKQLVCRLNKSLYRLKQAKLSEPLRLGDHQNSKNDYSLFYKKEGSSVDFIAIYVDDILMTGNNENKKKRVKRVSRPTIQNKRPGRSTLFSGIEVYNRIKISF